MDWLPGIWNYLSLIDSPQKVLKEETPMNSDTEDQEGLSEDQKRAIARAKKMAAPKSTSAGGTAQRMGRSKPMEEAKASYPMQARRQASGAGGLRSGGGSGKTDTCVAQGNPSKT
jgi:hypothetical protein